MNRISIIEHTLLMSLLSPISSRMGATSTVISGSSYFRILAGSQRNLRYGNTDVIGNCEVASKWPPSGRQVASKWPPSGLQVAAKWPPSGRQVAAKWPPSGRQVASKWPPSGRQVATKWPLLAFFLTGTVALI